MRIVNVSLNLCVTERKTTYKRNIVPYAKRRKLKDEVVF